MTGFERWEDRAGLRARYSSSPKLVFTSLVPKVQTT